MSEAFVSQPQSSVIIGLFGLPGAGKTTLKKHLEQNQVCISSFLLFEGSDVVGSTVPGGLQAFKHLSDEKKYEYREQAIESISRRCAESKKLGLVTGHFIFWSDPETNAPDPVLTPKDWNTYTHIIYLEPTASRIHGQIKQDSNRLRALPSIEHLEAWQAREMHELKACCNERGIPFQSIKVTEQDDALCKTLEFLNQIRVERQLDSIISSQSSNLRTILLLDGDKTLIAEDTGKMFWNLQSHGYDPLKEIFKRGYSYDTFREAAELGRKLKDRDFDLICKQVANKVTVRPEFVHLLRQIQQHDHVGAIVVTCGMGEVWKSVLKAAGVSERVQIIGSNRNVNSIVVTPSVKGAVADRLRSFHNKYVWAFGDSPVDLPMLCKADQAIVVVGEEGERSRSMEVKLAEAIEGGLEARQVLIGTNSHRLDTTSLPLVDIEDEEVMGSILGRLQYLHATEKSAAKLLASPTRDRVYEGPRLVEAHRQVGRYLATEYLGDVIGLEKYEIETVQGKKDFGNRLSREDKTVIVPLMRGGEPLGRGVWETFPTAMYVHAKSPSDLDKTEHIGRASAIVLVDGVINTGKSIAEFVEYIRSFAPKVKIVVVAQVVQAEAIKKDGVLDCLSMRYGGLGLIALRLSGNKYKGQGSTDTGHRLFNTTHME